MAEFINKPENMVYIKISVKIMNIKFNKCEPNFIKNICQGRCCVLGKYIAILPKEEMGLKKINIAVENGILKLKDNICPFFLKDTFLCSLHNTKHKPMSCILSPFRINDNNTLVIKRRNFCFKCFKKESNEKLPSYIVFKNSLIKLFGIENYSEIVKKMENKYQTDFYIKMTKENYKNVLILKDIINKNTKVK